MTQGIKTSSEANELARQQSPSRDAKPQIAFGQRGVELKSFDDLHRFAVAVSQTPFAPKGFENPASIMIAVQYGLEIGLSPMAALQGIAVVNGRPALYGDALLAVVLGSGLVEDFSEVFEGSAETRRAVCRVKRKGIATPIERSFGYKEAKSAGLWGKAGPWTLYPERMLQMRARSFALRDGFSDVTRGMIAAEEAQDIIPTSSVQPFPQQSTPEENTSPSPKNKRGADTLRAKLNSQLAEKQHPDIIDVTDESENQ